MPTNSVLGKLINGGDPNQLSREIIWALAEAGKFDYQVIFKEASVPEGPLTLTVTRKAKKQTLIIPGSVWRYRGGIRQAILDDLKI